MKKHHILLLSVLIFGFFLRFYQIDKIPSGFYSDEALVGYEAFSILKTGKDQYGNIFPVTFKAFGDYRPGLFIYSTVPFIWLFGLNEFGTRLPSVVFSTVTIFVIYIIAKLLFKNKKIALFSSLLFAISPWSIVFARMSHDTNLSTLVVSTAIYCLLKACISGNKRLFLMACFLFALSLYVYYTTRVFVPLFFIFSAFYFRRYFHKKQIVLGMLVAAVILLPLCRVLTNRETGWSRINAVNLWTDPGIKAKTESLVHEDVLMNQSYSKIFHNKFVGVGYAFLKSFTSHFTPEFLLYSGDPIKMYQIPDTGILLFIEPVLIITGVLILWKKEFQWNLLLLAWFLIGIFPDTLTRLYPAAARIHLALPVVSMVAAVGFSNIIFRLKRTAIWGKLGMLILIIIISYNMIYYFHSHFIHAPVRYASEWHYGLRDLIAQIKPVANNYDQIWVSKRVWGWVNFAFYLKYPPEKMQKEIMLSEKNEYGLGWVYQFGKYYFDDIPSQFDYNKNILYIGERNEFPDSMKAMLTVLYPDHSEAFIAVTTEEMRKSCKECSIEFKKL